MTIDSLFSGITKEIIDYIYKESHKRKNKVKLKYIINTFTEIAFKDVKPYLYTILIILILMFLTNCWTFYYYIKLFYSITNLPKNMNF
jgi:uncharacterized membrane protein